MVISLLIGCCADLLKAAPLVEELRLRHPECTRRLIFSGRAGDMLVATRRFEELGLAQPDANLGVPAGDGLSETTGLMLALKAELDAMRPAALVVFGDAPATLAGALAAALLRIPVARIDAGLRSLDRREPRELNRVLADAASEWLFTSHRSADANLRTEGLPEQKIHFVGSMMVDALVPRRPAAARMHLAERLGMTHPYVVVTLGKPENLDDALQRRSIAYALLTLADEFNVACAVSPHVRERIKTFDPTEMLGSYKRIRLLPTLGYVEFLSLLNDSSAVLTDSSGVQEQALVIGTPCVTLACYTKHPVTLVHGGNKLAGADPHLAVRYIREAINARAGYAPIPEGWDGHAAARIVDVLEDGLLDSPQSAQRAQSSS